MKKDTLRSIGFYSLSDRRAEEVSSTSQMERCELIITEDCNFSCPYCRGLEEYIYGSREVKQLSLSEVKYYIDLWCEGTPLVNIRFSGGEPTMHPDIVEIVEYAKSKGIQRIAISTNGSNDIALYYRLIEAGCNDFSISLDACCASDGDKLSGGVVGSWNTVIENIRILSAMVYVSVGAVLVPFNIASTLKTITLAHDLGVSDIRIISAAQYNKPIPGLKAVSDDILDAHPILKYRVNHFIEGRNVRGIQETDTHKCSIVLDDSVIAGDYHFPCVIYMREKGKPIGRVSSTMREDRVAWFSTHDTYKDKICRKNCLDVCIDHNNACEKFRVKR